VSGEGIRTPLDGVQRELGGNFVVGLGWRWVTTFGDPEGEYRAVRSGAGLWDASPHQKWDFSGPDALEALDRIVTRDLSRTEIGQVRYGPFCNEDGKMLGDGTFFRLAADHWWLVAAPGTDSDLTHFERAVEGLDVRIEKRTEELPQLGLNGPRSRDLLRGLCDRDVDSLRYYRFWPEPVRVGGVSCQVSRTGYSGELGYELFCAPDDAERLWRLLADAGARPYGLDAIEWLRIESGLIAMGADFVAGETSPFDMSLDRFVDLGKPRFSGREALSREAQAPPHRLVTLVVDGPVPAAGAPVTRDGDRVGTLTSPCRSPELGSVIGLAVLQRDVAARGTVLQVEGEDGDAPATVAPLSIVDPDKLRPRA
jgi:glycine cleavage system T protein (aminomethyltransferase)